LRCHTLSVLTQFAMKVVGVLALGVMIETGNVAVSAELFTVAGPYVYEVGVTLLQIIVICLGLYLGIECL
jgi:hypothetical protein